MGQNITTNLDQAFGLFFQSMRMLAGLAFELFRGEGGSGRWLKGAKLWLGQLAPPDETHWEIML